MGVTINNKSTTTEPCLRTDSSLSHRGGGGGGGVLGLKCIINLTHYDETKKRAHGSQIVRAEGNLKLSHGGSKPVHQKHDL